MSNANGMNYMLLLVVMLIHYETGVISNDVSSNLITALISWSFFCLET